MLPSLATFSFAVVCGLFNCHQPTPTLLSSHCNATTHLPSSNLLT